MRVRGVLIAALIVPAVAGCGDDKATPQQTCQTAWNERRGNAQAPGINHDDWMAECIKELQMSGGHPLGG